ncbi:MAG: DUF4129 domain-containing protein [Rhodocyclales bacterium]|nr:DUF4129 domain-containing protein [Rhodocyclales bacterium]
MQLDRIAIALRPRNAWQATDLGFALARRWWLSLWLAWCVPAAIVYVPLAVLLPIDYLWVPVIVVWWLKPVWDSVPIYLASRRLFGEAVSLSQAWRQSPRLLGGAMLPWLLWRRFSPTRSADLPVTLLERLGGAERAKRLRQLHPGMGRIASWHTVACVHFESVLVFGVLGLIGLMLPDEVDFNATGFVIEPDLLQTHAYNAVVFVAMSVVAPAYTMGGFMLYVCRRVELEGWDIEIRFRALAERAAPTVAGTLSGLLMATAVTIAVALGLAPQPVAAQTLPELEHPTRQDSSRASAQARINAVLADEEFMRKVERTTFKERVPSEEAKDEDKAAPEWLVRFFKWLASLGGERSSSSDDEGLAVADLVRAGLWVIAALVLVYVAARLRLFQALRGMLPARDGGTARDPETLFGLAVRPDSLPEDIATTALTLWRDGQSRGALALLYRATLMELMRTHQVPFASHHTEGECARLVDRVVPERAEFFTELTRAWQRLAYAHTAPDAARFEKLCRQWKDAFERAA